MFILACNPSQLFDLGFIYSFSIVMGLVLFYPHFDRPLRRIWQPDPMLPTASGDIQFPPYEIRLGRFLDVSHSGGSLMSYYILPV